MEATPLSADDTDPSLASTGLLLLNVKLNFLRDRRGAVLEPASSFSLEPGARSVSENSC